MQEYKMYRHPGMGYCAMVSTRYGWQQVSLWYASPGRLSYYWGLKNSMVFDKKTNRFVLMKKGC